ncbi:SpoIID/LytB domain-containing protein [Christensenellaceae bacterium OttesenSCG-928-L17]|nr:SpoIID/LytB domain-containing protein [Christensenellaceae bacterium OttesenSCG-928-L17]
MMHRCRRIGTICLVLLLLFSAVPARAAVFCSDVRVLISVGKPQTLSFTPVGTFTLQEDETLVVGNEELQISVAGGRVSLEAGGKTLTAASFTFLSADYGGRTDYIRLKNAQHGTCTYLGNMTFDVYEGAVRAINTLPIEQYLYGVVPHEMSNSFPLDALKAQAVCARGYAAARSSRYLSRAYDLLDTSQDQVYRGYASKNTRAIAAVDSTAGQVLMYDGDIIEAYYSASNGGQTEKTGNVWENDLPYYTHSDDPYDLMNASSLEETSFIPEEFNPQTEACMDPLVLLALRRAAYTAAGREVTLLKTIAVTPENPVYDEPSRAYEDVSIVLVVGFDTDGTQQTGQVTVTLPLASLRFGSFENTLGRMNASKTRLRLRGAERGVYYIGGQRYLGWNLTERRYGHGVGLSQRGAQERARAGQGYTDILNFYFIDTTLHTVGTYKSAPPIQSDVFQVREWGISKIPIGTTADKLLAGLSSSGELRVVTTKGASAAEVRTGYYVRVTYDEGLSFFDLPIVLYGDLDGDGAIAKSDIDALQNHLLRTELLTGARLNAADVTHDGKVDTNDLLLLIRCVNGDAKISQGG